MSTIHLDWLGRYATDPRPWPDRAEERLCALEAQVTALRNQVAILQAQQVQQAQQATQDLHG